MAQTCIKPMALNVGLVDNIQAVFIAEVVETMIVRVVRSTHRIDIRTLHCDDVLAHVINRNCFTFIGMVIVPIDTHNGDCSTIDAH